VRRRSWLVGVVAVSAAVKNALISSTSLSRLGVFMLEITLDGGKI
jgi:hypothetical protein